MRNPFSLMSLSLLALAGCSMTLPVQGIVQNSSESFVGTATGYADGAGILQVKSNQGTECKGNFVYITSRQGEGVFTCSDGRSGPFNFASTGSRGTGQGKLGGDTFVFTFGN